MYPLWLSQEKKMCDGRLTSTSHRVVQRSLGPRRLSWTISSLSSWGSFGHREPLLCRSTAEVGVKSWSCVQGFNDSIIEFAMWTMPNFTCVRLLAWILGLSVRDLSFDGHMENLNVDVHDFLPWST